MVVDEVLVEEVSRKGVKWVHEVVAMMDLTVKGGEVVVVIMVVIMVDVVVVVVDEE